MSPGGEEAPITARVSERPAFSTKRVRDVKPRDLVYRFAAGAATSIAAGVLTLVFGSRIGGIFLGFPAILGASLTLIEQQNDSAEAREDARGAVMGGVGMAMFAAVGALAFTHLPGGFVLLVAAGAWMATVLLGYLIVWVR
jgi:hypothetical protein